MTQLYARVTGGAFTSSRYTEAQLRFANTIAEIIAQGDEIYPVIGALENTGTPEAPVFRDPLQIEIDNKVAGVADLAQPLYTRDKGIPGGIASLNSDGDVEDNQIPDEFVAWLGTWDPRTNTPTLADGVGNIGDSYTVSEEIGNTDFDIDLGSGTIKVRGGMTIIFRATEGNEADGHWAVTGGAGLSAEDRLKLDNAMQNIATYTVACIPAAPSVTVGAVVLAQVTAVDCPNPEFHLVDDDGLSKVSLNAMSGELRVDTTGETPRVYNVKVRVGGNLGQSAEHNIAITVAAAV